MKKHTGLAVLLLYFAAIVIGCTSCSKDKSGGSDNSGDYYFRATIDGSKKNYHTVNFQGGGNDDRWEHVTIGGYEAPYPTNGGQVPPSLDFEIWRVGGNITPGTYTTPVEKNMISRYAIQTDAGTQLYNTSWGDDVFTVKIESISKQGIKGTFAGTLRNSEGKTKSVTDGSFNLPYETLVNP